MKSLGLSNENLMRFMNFLTTNRKVWHAPYTGRGHMYSPPGEGLFFVALTFIGLSALALAWYSAFIFFQCNQGHQHIPWEWLMGT